MDKQKLLQLKEDIDQAKNKLAQLEGRKKYLAQQLKDDWNCKTPKEGKQKLQSMKEEMDNLDTQIQKGIEQLEEEYDLD